MDDVMSDDKKNLKELYIENVLIELKTVRVSGSFWQKLLHNRSTQAIVTDTALTLISSDYSTETVFWLVL